MGLDMYLYREWYIGAHYEHRLVGGGITVQVGNALTDPDNVVQYPIDFKKISTVTELVGYWRKANAIHHWFVNNVQDGIDECQKSYVDQDKLKELYNVVCDVLDDPSQASTLLPTESGFFFGGTDYDKYYFDDLKYTKTLLEDILKEKEEATGNAWDIYYKSSW